jgi:chromosome segregation ATPase
LYGSVNIIKREIEKIDNELQSIIDAHSDEIDDLKSQVETLTEDVAYWKEHGEGLADDLDSTLAERAYFEEEWACALDREEELKLTIQELEEELEYYRVIENRTGKSPDEIIEMVSNLQSVVNSIKAKSSDE